MFKTGLTSITFRHLSVAEVIVTAKKAQFEGIEWGSDVHVPEGDLEKAREVRQQTEAAGLAISSYGSYFRADREAGDFTPFLESAAALGAPMIRVWAGGKGSADADGDYRAEVIESLRQAVASASAQDISIGLEYHSNTLTDTQESAHQLLAEVGSPALKLYWQPRDNNSVEQNLAELEAALPHLACIHAFHWGPGAFFDRLPFADGKDAWLRYLRLARKAEGGCYVLFEFTRDDSPVQLLEDANVLHGLLNNLS